jgi:DNA-3-methyladenine glycosylase II
MGRAVQGRSSTQSIAKLPLHERTLSAQDAKLARIIARDTERWPATPTEDPISGLLRIVVAQQVSTRVACLLAERLKTEYPDLSHNRSRAAIDVTRLRSFGIPESRARCCALIVERSDHIVEQVKAGLAWEHTLSGIKGIGPWTIAVFRIMVLRQPNVLPVGDLGLRRAINNVYGERASIERLSNKWEPFRSVACWYLWRTLGNQQLG